RSRESRRERRDPRPSVIARRTRQRALAGARRGGGPFARALAPPPGFSERLARPAREGRRTRHRVPRRHAELRLSAARPRRRADRARARAFLATRRLQLAGYILP